jgi:hypothetical protein
MRFSATEKQFVKRNSSMAKVKLNPFIKEAHGRLGDLVFKSSRNGETVVSLKPRKPKKTGGVDLPQKQRMQNAHAYAHAAMADPEKREQYERKAKKMKSKAYWMALSDYLSDSTE